MEVICLLTHFQWKPLYCDDSLPGWSISFYFKKHLYQAIYHSNGNIEFNGTQPAEEDKENLSAMIHELMIYHVYDK